MSNTRIRIIIQKKQFKMTKIVFENTIFRGLFLSPFNVYELTFLRKKNVYVQTSL